MEHRTDGRVIEVEALRKVYAGGVEAVKGIDFHVEPGEVFSLLGPNGAGSPRRSACSHRPLRPHRDRAPRRIRRGV
jgi:ABC-type branched-subunit amino acid transport system ATPase component